MSVSWSILSKFKNELYGISIIWIMLFHGLEFKGFSLSSELQVLYGFIKHGNCGVEMFLFLSGVFLYYSLKNKSIKTFYIKRIQRIFIPFFLINGVYWAYTCIIVKGSVLEFLKNITFYSFWFGNNKQVWFIALIIPLYIIYPIIFKYILNNEKINRLKYIVILIAIVYVLCYVTFLYNIKWYKTVEIALTRIPVFLLGCYCGILAYENKPINANVKIISLITIIFGIGYFYLEPISLVKLFRCPYVFIAPSIVIWVAICLFVINHNKFNKQLAIWGKLSLELYLSHIILRRIFVKSSLMGQSNVANFNKYVIFVIFGALVVSYFIKFLQKGNDK